MHIVVCYLTFNMRYTALALNPGKNSITVVTDWDVTTVDGKVPLYVQQGNSVQAA